jgi:hypothetical protein
MKLFICILLLIIVNIQLIYSYEENNDIFDGDYDDDTTTNIHNNQIKYNDDNNFNNNDNNDELLSEAYNKLISVAGLTINDDLPLREFYEWDELKVMFEAEYLLISEVQDVLISMGIEDTDDGSINFNQFKLLMDITTDIIDKSYNDIKNNQNKEMFKELTNNKEYIYVEDLLNWDIVIDYLDEDIITIGSINLFLKNLDIKDKKISFNKFNKFILFLDNNLNDKIEDY